MATYVPNATQYAEPVESRSVASAALEFRTLKERASDAVQYPAADPSGSKGTLPLSTARAGKILAFDVAGNPTAGSDAADVATMLTVTAEVLAGSAEIIASRIEVAINTETTSNNTVQAAASAAAAANSAFTAAADTVTTANNTALTLSYKNSAVTASNTATAQAVSASLSATSANQSEAIALNSKLSAELAADQAAISASDASLIIVSGLGFTASTAYDFGYVADSMNLFPTDYGSI